MNGILVWALNHVSRRCAMPSSVWVDIADRLIAFGYTQEEIALGLGVLDLRLD